MWRFVIRIIGRGKTYCAKVAPSSDESLRLVIPLRPTLHYAVRVEWTNLNEYPELVWTKGLVKERSVVFTAICDQKKQVTGNRWNRTVQCKIIRVE